MKKIVFRNECQLRTIEQVNSTGTEYISIVKTRAPMIFTNLAIRFTEYRLQESWA